MIDIADFAVGLSRQLYGLTMHSERPFHRMYEQWHPLGIVGIITAFNFPVAVWSWNALIAAVCGDAVLFKPSSKTPLTAIAIQKIIAPVVDRYGIDGVFNLVIGARSEVGDPLLNDPRIPLISATGSTAMGKKVAVSVGARLGRSLLELGGNNAVIVTPDCNLDMAVRAVLFGAVGTAGQRCTSTRRIIVHADVKEKFLTRLIHGYEQVKIGHPLEADTLMGPLIDDQARENMAQALDAALYQGGKLIYGGTPLTIEGLEGGCFVTPALVEAKNHYPIVQSETFAPILYILEYRDFEEAIRINNEVPQGLSSSIFTRSVRDQEKFLTHSGSDCGIANVNIGTSGAEIGGAFGGEKETGGGRESGSDAWKAYMRRQTNTINFGDELPLAQGITFNVGGEKNEQ
jgi:aldehyde dehydrogenase (NAD+)